MASRFPRGTALTVIADVTDNLIGSVIQDRYRVISRIGDGGMGVVYEVEHVLIRKRFALKLLHRTLTQDPEVVERFHREARASATIGDEHIAEVSDMGYLTDGTPYIVLELLNGHDLAAELKRVGPLPVARAISIARQCCQALEAAHQKGIVHRDIKPDNIFLTTQHGESDFVKVVDFGISKFQEAAIELEEQRAITKTGIMLGTPYYMSPEQVSASKDVDARTDIYAMGVVLFQMLVGRVPFNDKSYPVLTFRIMSDPPPRVTTQRSDVPARLEAVILRTLAKDPDDRYDSMAELSDALAPFEKITSEPKIVLSEGGDSDTPSVDFWTQLEDAQMAIGPQFSEKLKWLATITVGVVIGTLSSYFVVILNEEESVVTEQTVREPRSPGASQSKSPLVAIAKEPSDRVDLLRGAKERGTEGRSDMSRSAGSAGPKSAAITSGASRKSIQRSKASSAISASTVEQPADSIQDKTSKAAAVTESGETAQKSNVLSTSITGQTLESKEDETSQAAAAIGTAEPLPQSKIAYLDGGETRTVAVNNHRRASVKVTLSCGKDTVETTVPAKSQTSLSILKQECRVTCTGVGHPYCSIILRPASQSLEID
jgi:serine/threonine protein kinase